MKKIIFALIVLLTACNEDDSIFSRDVFQYGQTTFQITNVYETNVELECKNPAHSLYSITFSLDGVSHSYLYFPQMESINARYEFSYIKITKVTPLAD
ncbi:hypothetical protein [Gaoshiqia sediminis]|uniref:Lipoprotein n=1 Tax=Gaoshiqia sediminis TaxID=2986998 RepID=A0AA41Y615_9BACT|nr:hypothetical protein [Gaoshiqia sediminis]MCW0484071.1 hypothetical protein [Gaoshiqia sediminis]